MRRDYNAAIKAAVNGLYDGSLDSCQRALWDVLEALDPAVAASMHEDEESTRSLINDEFGQDDDADDEVSNALIDDELGD